MHVFHLRPIQNEEEAHNAEAILEYIERAFEGDPPQDILDYREILLLLIDAYDSSKYTAASANLSPAAFLKLLLEEFGIEQKALVPECFKSESQVSEFLNQRPGRQRLSYAQACALARHFAVDPLNFL